MAESQKSLSTLDFLVETLIRHDRELTTLAEKLQASIQLLDKERLTEKLGPIINKSSEDISAIEKMDEVVGEIRALGEKMQKIESRSAEFEASIDLSSAQSKTLRTLSDGKRMSIGEVTKLTGRSRTSEIVYLNQLERLGLVEKTKEARKYYYAKKLLQQPLTEGGAKKVLILVLVSENASGKNQDDISELVSRRLSDLKDWRLKKSTILSG